MFIILLLAVIGLIWLYISANKWKKAIKRAWNNEKATTTERIKNTWNEILRNPYGKDVKISLAFTLLGGLILAGVTGMAIGLVASTAISAIIWISAKFKGINKFTDLAE